MKSKNQQSELKKLLRKGDMTILSNATGIHRISVSKMFSGVYKMDAMVKEAAEKLVETRRRKIEETINQ